VVLALGGSETARTHGVAAPGPGGYRIKHGASGGGGLLVLVAERPEVMPHAAYGLLGTLGCAFGFGEEAVNDPDLYPENQSPGYSRVETRSSSRSRRDHPC
jgi:hypothetical protein